MSWYQHLAGKTKEQVLSECYQKFENVRSFSYKGYNVITFSGQNHGFGYVMFQGEKYLKYRRYVWYGGAEQAIMRHIDCLVNEKKKEI